MFRPLTSRVVVSGSIAGWRGAATGAGASVMAIASPKSVSEVFSKNSFVEDPVTVIWAVEVAVNFFATPTISAYPFVVLQNFMRSDRSARELYDERAGSEKCKRLLLAVEGNSYPFSIFPTMLDNFVGLT